MCYFRLICFPVFNLVRKNSLITWRPWRPSCALSRISCKGTALFPRFTNLRRARKASAFHSMVFRFIIRLLANNEHLVQKLSESYPMRKAAQIVVRAMFTGRNFIEENRLHEKLTPDQFRVLMKDISKNFQKQVKQAQENIQRKMK